MPSAAWVEYERIFKVLMGGSPADLDAEAARTTGFPHGVDDCIGRRWIINAVDSKSLTAVRWMLSKRVDLNFRDEEGYTPIHSALESEAPDRLEILRALLEAGAPVNLKGMNDWTPAHMAAARDDVEALKLLIKHGADLTIRTTIDDCATPLEEARSLRQHNAVRFLERIR